MLSESTYKENISSLLETGSYEILHNDPTSQIERKIWELLTKYKTFFPAASKRKVTPYQREPPHLYGLPKLHKPGITLRLVISSIDPTYYALADFLHKILSLQVGNVDFFVKDSEQFIKLILDINLQNEDCHVRFDVVSLFTNLPVEAVLQVIINSTRILVSQNSHLYKLKT
jgi:hypothetical protein